MFFTLITTVLAGEPQALADLTELTTGYGTALSRVVNDPDWTEESLESLVTDPDWRVAHQARVVLAWRADGVRAADHWTLPPMPSRAQGLARFPGGAEAYDMVFLDRLLHADEPPQTRAALIEACHRSVFDESDAFYELLLEEPSALVRENLVYSLIRTERGLEGLRLGLEDEDLGVRQVAARGVSARTDGRLLQPELLLALQDSAPEVRAGAARSLGVLQLTATASALVPLLQDVDAEVRLHALRALDRLGAADVHAPELGTDPDPRVQRLSTKITGR